MFLVGGFSESPMLQVEMRKEFCHLLKIIIPQDVALTILKGFLLIYRFLTQSREILFMWALPPLT